jgi:Ca-activated chloride channel family protein
MRKRYDWDDPRLTAYVLGELSDRERAEVDAELANNATARKVVAEIREMSDLLTEELGQEPSPALSPEQRATILGWSGRRAVAPRFNRFFVLVASATACLLAFAGVVYRTHVLQERRATGPEIAMLTEDAANAPIELPLAKPSLQPELGLAAEDELETARGVTETADARARPASAVGGIAPEPAPAEEDAAERTELAMVVPESVAKGEGATELDRDKLRNLGYVVEKPAARGGTTETSKLLSEYAPTVNQPAPIQPDAGAESSEQAALFDSLRTVAEGDANGIQAGVAVGAAGQKKAETFVGRPAELLASAKEPEVSVGDIPVVGQLLDDQKRFGGVQTGRRVSRLGTAGVGGRDGDLLASAGSEGVIELQEIDVQRDRPMELARRESDEEQPESRYFFEMPQEDERVHRGRPERPSAETYEYIVDNPFRRVADAPLSTFSIDVDTASYTNIRRFLTRGQLPPKQAVRIEEMVNYFAYDYPQPRGKTPFSVNVEVAACPWKAEHKLARVGIKGKDIMMDDRPAANLVFLLDVSGSMKDQNKLPLLKSGMELLTKKLARNDKVAIVTYRDDARCVLDSTPAAKRQTILKAIGGLHASGSTNGAAGIDMAYEIAADNFVDDGINRVILATDGDFNVGVTERSELIDLIEGRAKTGVFLTVLGFGTGNLKDANLEALADKGNGHYAYIDSFNEARKVLMEQVGGTFFTIAKDVKIQIEFNPGKVDAYRLIGYENRMLADRDFADDRKDAGEIGAGHTVTALYEVVPRGKGGMLPGVDQLKYQQPPDLPDTVVKSDDLMNVRLRYKAPDGDTSTMVESPVGDSNTGVEQASAEFKFAAAVAGFGMLLRDSDYMGDTSFDLVIKLARAGKGTDEEGHRAEFINLVKTAQALKEK